MMIIMEELGKGSDVPHAFLIFPFTGNLRTYKIIVSLYRLNEKFTISLHSIYEGLIKVLYY